MMEHLFANSLTPEAVFIKKYLVGSCAFNEGEKIKRVIQKYNDYACYDVLIIDDGSTDGSLLKIPLDIPVAVIRNETTQGAGHCIRQIFDYARKRGYVAVFFASGNDKDDPQDLVKLKNAIEEGFDFVQGSRYLQGGGHGRMPIYRKITTRFIHPMLFSLITGRKITDSTNGCRAVRLSLLDDLRMDIAQDWLDAYELEPYMFYKAIKLGYKVKEVPVTKIYPPKEQGYTKMKPFSGWWSILRPLIYLGLGIKK
jgi:dolichol-phosphate mannosyltransferase